MYYDKGWCGAHSAKGETPTLVHTHTHRHSCTHTHARSDDNNDGECGVVAMIWMMLMNDDDNEEEEKVVSSHGRCYAHGGRCTRQPMLLIAYTNGYVHHDITERMRAGKMKPATLSA